MQYFFDIAEGATFLDVAFNHHISQSSVSKAIKRLEDELEVKLLSRTTRATSLTPAGARLHGRLKTIIPEINEMLADLRELKHANHINCRVIPSKLYNIKRLFLSFTAMNPHVEVVNLPPQMPVHKREKFLAEMQSGDIDLAFVHRYYLDDRVCDYTLFHEDHLLALLLNSNELAAKDVLSPADLLGRNVIINPFRHEMLGDHIAKLDVRLKVRIRSDSRDSIIEHLGSNDIALFYETDIDLYNLKAINATTRRITGFPENSIYVATPKGKRRTEAQQALIDYLTEQVDNLRD